MKRLAILIISLGLVLILSACGARNSQTKKSEKVNDSEVSSKASQTLSKEKQMKFFINDKEVDVIWANNAAVKELLADAQKKPLKIKMSQYGGFEQVGSLGKNYPANDKKMTTQSGDIVLYSKNQLVLFYGSNTWSYTKLGKVTKSQQEMTDLLSKGDVSVIISSVN